MHKKNTCSMHHFAKSYCIVFTNFLKEIYEQYPKEAISLGYFYLAYKYLLYYNTLSLFKLECACIKLIIGSALCNQIVVIASFNDSAVVKNHNGIRVSDG